jgi:hypothetical protein
MIMFLLCKAQNLRIMNYLKTFATKHNWNRIVEIGGLYLIIFTKFAFTDFMGTILELLKYLIPALVVLAASYLIVNNFLTAEYQRKQLALFKDSQDITLRLRLQAYERMVLFVERISPRQLIPRVYDGDMTVRDLQMAMTISVRGEFEHNLSQQIYVSRNVWETVKNVKEQELNMINRIAQTLDPEAPARDLHARILEVTSNPDVELPTDVALQIIHTEVRTVMSTGNV